MKIARVTDSKGNIVLAAQKADGVYLRCAGDDIAEISADDITEECVEVGSFLVPLEPRAVICVAASYRAHIAECNMEEQPDPIIFMKDPASVNAHQQAIRIPSICADEVDYEGELALYIGRDCLNVSAAEAGDYILGYTAANDVSARSWQLERGGGQWVRGKGFDSFAPLGPVLVTPDEIGDVKNLRITTTLNGQMVQNSNTSYMIRDVYELVSFLSQGTTLLAGTVILTGTPEGVGWARQPRLLLQDGDDVVVEIENVGKLVNHVVRGK